MTRTIALLAVAVLLTGCSAAAPEATPTPTPSPTPTVMSTAEAGEMYLSIVCPPNAANDAAYAAAVSGDLAAIQTTAAAARDASQDAARKLDDPATLWPETVVDDLPVLLDSYLANASAFDAQSKSATLDEFYATPLPLADEAAEASQRIRLRLDLSADTAIGCEEYE